MNLRTSLLSLTAFAAGLSGASATDIPSIAVAADDFDTLVAALTATDLVGAISAPNGPFTVFAPTDKAFAALPEGLVSCLLEEENLPILTEILLYHVAPGAAFSTDLSNGMEVATLASTVRVRINPDGVFINDATVITPDIEATNGVIHVIDSVLVPGGIDVPAFLKTCQKDNTGDLVDIPTLAIENGSFTTLVAALSAVDLVGAISAPEGPFTVFAPTDDAFGALPSGYLQCLLDRPKVLTDILLYHVVSGEAFSTDLRNGQRVPTLLEGAAVTVRINKNGVRINKSDVVIADLEASNGVVHVIDEVLVPGRVNLARICGGSSSGSSMTPIRGNNNKNPRPACHYNGRSAHAGEWLTGPTHTCYCQPDGRWTHCRVNRNHGQYYHNGWNRWGNYWYGH